MVPENLVASRCPWCSSAPCFLAWGSFLDHHHPYHNTTTTTNHADIHMKMFIAGRARIDSYSDDNKGAANGV
jgi:hypothetical protein